MVPRKPTIALTVDHEEFTVPREFGEQDWPDSKAVEISIQGMNVLTEILEEENIQATIFSTGLMAAETRDELIWLVKRGNEIANHGLTHFRNHESSKKTSVLDVAAAHSVIAQITGAKPQGYRKTMLGGNRELLTQLTRLGYCYDSSVLPLYVPGRYNALSEAAAPAIVRGLSSVRDPVIVELPISVSPLFRVPVGWWWFRKNFGARLCLMGFRRIWQRELPVVAHVHLWEFVELPRAPHIPRHVSRNCGPTSVKQVRTIIREAKRMHVNFVTAYQLAREILSKQDRGPSFELHGATGVPLVSNPFMTNCETAWAPHRIQQTTEVNIAWQRSPVDSHSRNPADNRVFPATSF